MASVENNGTVSIKSVLVEDIIRCGLEVNLLPLLHVKTSFSAFETARYFLSLAGKDLKEHIELFPYVLILGKYQ